MFRVVYKLPLMFMLRQSLILCDQFYFSDIRPTESNKYVDASNTTTSRSRVTNLLDPSVNETSSTIPKKTINNLMSALRGIFRRKTRQVYGNRIITFSASFAKAELLFKHQCISPPSLQSHVMYTSAPGNA